MEILATGPTMVAFFYLVKFVYRADSFDYYIQLGKKDSLDQINMKITNRHRYPLTIITYVYLRLLMLKKMNDMDTI